jgi:hypothetical protein
LVALAPSSGAVDLDKKAWKLVMQLHQKFDNGKHTVCKEDITTTNAAIDIFRQEMAKLPQWTKAEIKAAIEALPEEDPRR